MADDRWRSSSQKQALWTLHRRVAAQAGGLVRHRSVAATDAAPRYCHISVDLLDREDAATNLSGPTEATHVFYAAFQPAAGDAEGLTADGVSSLDWANAQEAKSALCPETQHPHDNRRGLLMTN
jgi:hypothetical protein